MNGQPPASLMDLVNRHLPLPGVAAWGARLADRTFASHGYSDWFAARQIEQILGRLTLAADNLAQHGIQPARLCWTFDHARIYLVVRPDGTNLAVFVENRPGSSAIGLENLFSEFAAAPAGQGQELFF